MMTLIAAVLAAAPAAPENPPADVHSGHMQMGQSGQHEHKKGCECCKDMAKEHEGHVERGAQSGQ